MYMISSHKKGISSYQLAKDIEVTQATAWYMLQKVRKLYRQDDSQCFQGTVECDEVYIGGKEKWRHKSMRTPNTQGRSTKTKTPVFGMMQRGTDSTTIHVFVVKKADRDTLQTMIGQFVVKGSNIITDELSAYSGLNKLGYRHLVVNHGSEQYADGGTFTNSIEGFWSHFRRMIFGIYHNVSDEHLQDYIDEVVYRWNMRKTPQTERFKDMFNKSIGLIVRWNELRLCEVG